jgi:hypothetical protein
MISDIELGSNDRYSVGHENSNAVAELPSAGTVIQGKGR